MDTNVAVSPAVDDPFTMPTPLQDHLFSTRDASGDHSFVFTQSAKVPAGTFTNWPTSTI
jgi:hypothetical protein